MATVTLKDAVDDFLIARTLAQRTLDFYRENLSVFLTFATQEGISTVEDVSRPLFRKFTAHVGQRTNPQTGKLVGSYTTHAYARSLKVFLRWCVEEGLLDDKVPQRLPMPKIESRIIQALSDLQLDRLVRAAQSTATPFRDQAIVYVLSDTGIRASELCGLTFANMHLDRDDSWLLVFGKGSKERPVGVGKDARLLLHRYLTRERKGEQEGNVFLGIKGPLTPSGLDQLLYRLRDLAGPEHFRGVRISAHSFRHTFAVNYLKDGGDIFKLKVLMGHTDIAVTQQYLRSFDAHDARRASASVMDKRRAGKK